MGWLAGLCALTVAVGIGGLVWAATGDRYRGERRAPRGYRPPPVRRKHRTEDTRSLRRLAGGGWR